MGDRMRTIPFEGLLNWILEEYRREKAIFGIPENNFYRYGEAQNSARSSSVPGLAIGPAAGPHTQLAQNLAAAYLAGGRFFELKTVQVIDSLEFPKPCINARDECYNTEWSTELSIGEACAEYVKGWFLLHLLSGEFLDRDRSPYVFDMSVGYDLAGIKSVKVDHFIDTLKDASSSDIFRECLAVLKKESSRFKNIDAAYVDSISPYICSSIALSTMHGCPPAEIEAICSYLLLEKKLHTHVKLNPTLLGFDFVRETLDRIGYDYIVLKEETFSRDLSYEEALPMLQRLMAVADESDFEFGIKLSNTLPVRITRSELPGEEMYLSGRPLYVLTINLAARLASDLNRNLKISYSGGADRKNLAGIMAAGIEPVTVVTTLLKPNGYRRLNQLAAIAESEAFRSEKGIDRQALKKIAAEAITEPTYHKRKKKEDVLKAYRPLPLFDCRSRCAICVDVCPNRANIAQSVESEEFQYDRQILHVDGMCNECGNCATFCPEQGKPYLEKFTLFWLEEDFLSSSNSGFIVSSEDGGIVLKFRKEREIVQYGFKSMEEMAAAVNVKVGKQDPASSYIIERVCGDYRYLLDWVVPV